MSCKLELILQAILPFVASGFDVYSASHGSRDYVKVDLSEPVVCHAARLLVASKSDIKPFETEQPIDALRSELGAVPDIEILKLVNRTGPFYGYYLEIRPLSGSGA